MAPTRSACKYKHALSDYITRIQAAERFGGTSADIFQGDIYSSLELMAPRIGGVRDYSLSYGMVVSHDCEWTKVGQLGLDYPLLVAPLRPLSAFQDDGKDGLVRKLRVRYLFPLPVTDALDDEYAVDLRLIQPLTAAELVDGDHVTSLGDLKTPLQGFLLVFFTNRKPPNA